MKFQSPLPGHRYVRETLIIIVVASSRPKRASLDKFRDSGVIMPRVRSESILLVGIGSQTLPKFTKTTIHDFVARCTDF